MNLSLYPVAQFSRSRDLDAAKYCLLVLLALLFCAHPQTANAHPAPFSYLDLHLEERAIRGSITVHTIDLAHELDMDEPAKLLDQGVLEGQYSKVTALLAEEMRLNGWSPDALRWSGYTALPDDLAVRFDFSIDSPPPPELVVQAHFFPYDRQHQTFVNVYEGETLREQWIFGAGSAPRSHFAGSAAGRLAVLETFVPEGVHHILIGPDHILFIVGLILLGGTWRRLALIVTSFTLGHSITLSLAALDLLVVPADVVEPLIALSIIVVGADNLLQDRAGEGSATHDLRWVFAAAFGLIHGFGFAYVLQQVGLPTPGLGWALFGFNLGVEIGQLAIVIPVATLLYLVRRGSEAAARRIATTGSLAVIAAGAYWFLDRIINMGGV